MLNCAKYNTFREEVNMKLRNYRHSSLFHSDKIKFKYFLYIVSFLYYLYACTCIILM